MVQLWKLEIEKLHFATRSVTLRLTIPAEDLHTKVELLLLSSSTSTVREFANFQALMQFHEPENTLMSLYFSFAKSSKVSGIERLFRKKTKEKRESGNL